MKSIYILIYLLIFTCHTINAQNYSAPSSAATGSGTNNTVVGDLAGSNLATNSSNSIFGFLSGASLTTGSNNCFFGSDSGFSSTEGGSNSFFGRGTGSANTTGSSNSFFGTFAGTRNETADDNSFFGIGSGFHNISGSGNSFFGKHSGLYNTSGKENCFFGKQSGQSNTTGLWNAFYGFKSGSSNISGTGNSFFGQKSGERNSSGSGNTFLGRGSGMNNLTGKFNTYVGMNAGSNSLGFSNICIGYGAGPTNSSNSEKLYIDIQQSDDPLIYGDFDNDFVKINGTFEVTAGLSNPSDENLKTNFQNISEQEVLEKVSTLPILRWTYKNRQQELHVGATAQDFYKAFGLGSGNKNISTIDADGIALLAIKALKKENDILKGQNKRMIELIVDLTNRIEKLE